MTQTEHLLTILSEECIETAQRVSKAIRFGLEEVQPGQPLTNADRIFYEFNDLLAVIEILEERGLIPKTVDRTAINEKKRKVKKYMDYAVECGTIDNGPQPLRNASPTHDPMYAVPASVLRSAGMLCFENGQALFKDGLDYTRIHEAN